MPGKIKIRLVWHRKGDLRIHDNELYHATKDGNANGSEDSILKIFSLYIIDPEAYEPRDIVSCRDPKKKSQLMQTVTEGPHTSRALIEALRNLRENLQTMGGDLLLRRGDPLRIVPEMADALQAQEVVWSEVPGYYERELSENLKMVLRQQCSIRTVAGYTLWHPDDLPQKAEMWSRLARPKEQKKKKKSNTTTTDREPKSSSIHKKGTTSSSSGHTIDCSPQRWRGIPLVMGDFRRAARTAASIRHCLPPPPKETIQGLSDNGNIMHDPGELPTMAELTSPYQGCSLLGLPASTINFVIQCASSKSNEPHHDNNRGETSARQQWEHFLQNHAATANRSLADTSSDHQSAHISTFLALGVLSPRHIYWSVLEHHHSQTACQWLISHMEMRDYFLYSAFAADRNLYNLHGQPQQQLTVHKTKKRGNGKTQHNASQSGQVEWKDPWEHLDQFTKWATGMTGLPLVDAGMKELMTTGYCSNRVRQNMASVLTKDLLLDWRVGAEWFQFCLEDHCVAANWGNWRYFSGVGGDPKNRHFRTVSQAIRYDPTGSYVRKWLPRLKQEEKGEGDEEYCFRPWDILEDWPDTLIDPTTQYTWRDRQRLEENRSSH